MISTKTYLNLKGTKRCPVTKQMRRISKVAAVNGYLLTRQDIRTVESWLTERCDDGGNNLEPADILTLSDKQLWKAMKPHVLACEEELPEQNPKITEAAMKKLQELAEDHADRASRNPNYLKLSPAKKELRLLESFIFELFATGCGEASGSKVFFTIYAHKDEEMKSHPICFQNPDDVDGHGAYAAVRTTY